MCEVAGRYVRPDRARDALEVDAVVIPEVVIFDRQERVDERLRNLVVRDELAPFLGELAEQRAVCRVDSRHRRHRMRIRAQVAKRRRVDREVRVEHARAERAERDPDERREAVQLGEPVREPAVGAIFDRDASAGLGGGQLQQRGATLPRMSARPVPIVVAIVAIGGGAWWWLRSAAPSASARTGAADPEVSPPVAREPSTAPDRPWPALPDNPPPPLPTGPTAEQKFEAEPIDRAWASTTQIALAERLETVSNIKATECHSMQCRIIVVGTPREVGKSIELLTSDRALHSYARTITLTTPTRRDDFTLELHAFAQFAR